MQGYGTVVLCATSKWSGDVDHHHHTQCALMMCAQTTKWHNPHMPAPNLPEPTTVVMKCSFSSTYIGTYIAYT